MLTSFLGVNDKFFIEGIEASNYINKTASLMMNKQLASPTIVLGDWFYDMGFRKIDKEINHRMSMIKEWGTKIIRSRIQVIE